MYECTDTTLVGVALIPTLCRLILVFSCCLSLEDVLNNNINEEVNKMQEQRGVRSVAVLGRDELPANAHSQGPP